MSTRCVWLASLLCLAFVAWRPADAAPVPEDRTRPHTDQYGDPLPDGALARIGTVRFRHGNTVSEVHFSPDGKTLAAIGYDAVRLRDPTTGRELRHYDGEPSFYRGCWFPDGRGLWLQAYKGAIYSWDLTKAGGPTPAPFKGEHTWFVAASPDGKTLTAGSKDVICLYDVQTAAELRRLEGHKEDVLSVSFSVDGTVLASQTNHEIIVWDPVTGEQKSHVETGPVDRTKGPRPSFRDVVLSPDGRLVVAAVENRRIVTIWDSSTGKELRSVTLGRDDPRSFTFSPDGKLLAVATQKEVRLHQVANGEDLWHYAYGTNLLCDLAFSPDGKTLAGAFVGVVRLWDVPTGQEIFPIPECRTSIRSISLSPDGRVVTTEESEWRTRSPEPERRTGRCSKAVRCGNRPAACLFAG